MNRRFQHHQYIEHSYTERWNNDNMNQCLYIPMRFCICFGTFSIMNIWKLLRWTFSKIVRASSQIIFTVGICRFTLKGGFTGIQIPRLAISIWIAGWTIITINFFIGNGCRFWFRRDRDIFSIKSEIIDKTWKLTRDTLIINKHKQICKRLFFSNCISKAACTS